MAGKGDDGLKPGAAITPPARPDEALAGGADILIVDDEQVFARAVARRLGRAGYRCRVAHTLSAAEHLLAGWRPRLIVLDMRLPDGSGLDFLARLRIGAMAATPVIVLTAFSEVDDAVTVMKHRALDYLRKPVDLDQLTAAVDVALSGVSGAGTAAAVELLGDSPALRALRTQLERISRLSNQAEGAPPTVLIQGETGTGKDVAARYLHAHSARAARPFVHVDCAALPKDLIEAELFGHEKGAFTGAQAARTGLLEEAADGTVFLDEVGELGAALQTKLLAVLERRILRRLGSSRERPLRAWFIAATNRSLDAMVAAGEFRADLYFRLKILTLELPPLRQRAADAVLLAQHYAALTARRYGFPEPRFSAAARTALGGYRWPGNVRELVHLIERAVLLHGAESGELDSAELGLPLAEPGGPEASPPNASVTAVVGETLESAEGRLIREALERAEGNVSRAARALGVTRMTLRYRMQKYGIQR